MFKKLFMLFKIGRKLSTSGAISSIYEIYDPPITIKILFFVIGFSFNGKKNNNNLSPGVKLCNALQGMGTTFIKLGQFLATRPDIIGEDIAKELEKLQDKLPPFQLKEAKNILRKELGKENFDKIINFSDSIAAASIAQVHFATISDFAEKKEVAIKILRPNIEKTFNEELDALMLLAYIIQNLIRKTKRLKLIEVIQLLREITNMEMDLRFEAAAANELYENTTNDVGFKVPKIYWNYTSKRVLCLDKINGISIREIENLKSLNIDTKKLAKDIIQHFLRHAVRDGFFHADMHQGNLFVNKDGSITAVDFGIMGRLDKNNRKYLAEILYGFIKRDYKKVAEVHFLAGLVPKEVSKDEFAQALRSIGEPIFGQSVKNISGGKLLSQLFEITEKFNMQTQIQLLLLQKTMVVVEGVARKLDPDTNIWDVSKPILENWLKEVKDPINKASEVVNKASEVLSRLPDLPIIMDKANDVMTLISEGKFNPNTLAYKSLREEELKLELMRNKILGGVLVLVIFVLIVFK
ncbi:MAG TPA: 2-polyprenylphenol 6-hydroxylase [Pelagibacteraceae bacterium]|jgi:ubiquinone biosynthesis protein|nr:2-polyprenylphenol 6-hydroxylase [Pelagibacteraceae bacterium]